MAESGRQLSVSDACRGGARGGDFWLSSLTIVFGDLPHRCFQPGRSVFRERMCVFLAKEEAERACGRGDGSVDSRPIICTADVCVCLCGGIPECV